MQQGWNISTGATGTPARLDFSIDDPELREIALEFVQLARDQCAKLSEALADNEVENLRLLLHWFKGAGGTAGFPMISELAAAGQQQMEWGEVDRVRRTVLRLADLIEEADAAVAGAAAASPEAPEPDMPEPAEAKPAPAPASPGASAVCREQAGSELSEADAAVREARILIADDAPPSTKVIARMLREHGFTRIETTNSALEVLPLLSREPRDVLLLDVVMPAISGLDVLRQVRMTPALAHLPVLVLTADAGAETRRQALEAGATDFLTKPVEPFELVARVRNAAVAKLRRDELEQYAGRLEHEVRRRTQELERTRREVVYCLARAAEYRDNETGRHILRVGRFAGLIAEGLGATDAEVEQLELAAALHDVGKIGIPDAILLKPGKLSPEEFALMERHTLIGRGVFEAMSPAENRSVREHVRLGGLILGESHFDLLRLAKVIAQTHHERFDGTGYPMGLAGEDIPLPGRIVSVADVYDALSSVRPYKSALPREKCFAILEEGRGTHFDPKVLDAFFSRSAQIIDAQIELADPAPAPAA